MKIDDSFKKPGSVPFKWEIRPGVPKHQNPQTLPSDHHHSEFGSVKQHQRKPKQVQQKQSQVSIHKNPFQETPKKLKPPPAGLYYHPPMTPQTRTHSFRSSPRTFSHRFGLPGLARPDVVPSVGCFPSPIGKVKNVKKRTGYPRSAPEPDYYSDQEISSRWSVSSRKSVSVFPLSSSFASYQSSPRPVSDADWAGFGLF